MIAIRALSSRVHGLGHLFRSIRLADALGARGEEVIILPEENSASRSTLDGCGHRWHSFAFDGETRWIADLVREFEIATWINDRLATPRPEALAITQAGARFVTFDDEGDGSALSALNVAALPGVAASLLQGQRVLRGLEYLVLDPEFRARRRVRASLEQILVAIGGTDTYALTPRVAQVLKNHPARVTLLLGPGSEANLQRSRLAEDFEVICGTPSLARLFERFDLAVTAGGIMPFEANCTGLPCVIISTEPWERGNAEDLAARGGAVHAGYRDSFDPRALLAGRDLGSMSKKAMLAVDGLGLSRVVEAIYRQ